MEEQLFLNLFGEMEPSIPAKWKINPFHLRQKALGFLLEQQPDGAAGEVITRFRKYRAAAAAYWCADGKDYRGVVRTAIIDVFCHREECFANCVSRDELLRLLKELQLEKELLEESIRLDEPFLQSADDLFQEFRSWHYDRSANPDYQQLLRKIRKLQHCLYKGGKLERIARANLADQLWLLVPENLITTSECAPEWGLLYIDQEENIRCVKSPSPQTPANDARIHLALNIGAASRIPAAFARGVNQLKSGAITYSPPPKRRRKRQ